MMTITKTFPTQDAAGLSIADTRLVMSGLVAQNANGSPRLGVFPAGTAPIVTGNSGMTYQVAPFEAAVSRTGTGVELIANDASMAVATDNAPGANSRIDVIYVQPRFVGSADASNVPILAVAKGVAAPSPVKPAIPAGAFELATAVILSTTLATSTAVITQTHPYTAAAGGVVLVRSIAERDAWAAPENAIVRVIGTGATFRRTASGWERQLSVSAQANPGASIAGIGIPGTAIEYPPGTMIKSGIITSFTTAQFGNEYMPRVTFSEPFPTSMLAVTFAEVQADGAVAFGKIATDDVSRTGFRVLYPGTSSSTKRAFIYTAIGY